MLLVDAVSGCRHGGNNILLVVMTTTTALAAASSISARIKPIDALLSWLLLWLVIQSKLFSIPCSSHSKQSIGQQPSHRGLFLGGWGEGRNQKEKKKHESCWLAQQGDPPCCFFFHNPCKNHCGRTCCTRWYVCTLVRTMTQLSLSSNIPFHSPCICCNC